MSAIFKVLGTAGVRFAGDGERVEFPFSFVVFASDDVMVRLGEGEVTSGFHIALNDPDDAPGGMVRFDVPPQSGEVIAITRRLRLRRLSAYGGTASPRGDGIDRDLDYLTAALGDVDRAMSGSVRLDPENAETASAALPKIAAGRALIWNDAGNRFAHGPGGGRKLQCPATWCFGT